MYIYIYVCVCDGILMHVVALSYSRCMILYSPILCSLPRSLKTGTKHEHFPRAFPKQYGTEPWNHSQSCRPNIRWLSFDIGGSKESRMGVLLRIHHANSRVTCQSMDPMWTGDAHHCELHTWRRPSLTHSTQATVRLFYVRRLLHVYIWSASDVVATWSTIPWTALVCQVVY